MTGGSVSGPGGVCKRWDVSTRLRLSWHIMSRNPLWKRGPSHARGMRTLTERVVDVPIYLRRWDPDRELYQRREQGSSLLPCCVRTPRSYNLAATQNRKRRPCLSGHRDGKSTNKQNVGQQSLHKEAYLR